MAESANDRTFMSRAIELAQQGRGYVEPNPMVGCVVVQADKIVGEGWHQRFGGDHAEVIALAAAGQAAHGAVVYVTLEPCCHQGKTAACSGALVAAGVARVVVGCRDPNPQVSGGGLAELRAAGIEVQCDVLAQEAKELVAPFSKLMAHGKPWVIAKWAMTLDGKLASRAGKSQWISGETSRAVVHRLRGQVDAILVGRGTVDQDDPLLTARPPGPRTAVRVVLDSTASLSADSQLVQSLDQGPVLLAVAEEAPAQQLSSLQALGVDVVVLPGRDEVTRLQALLEELGKRQLTNLLVEGGAHVLGTLLDIQSIDEVHAFVAAKLLGGKEAPSAMAGTGLASMAEAIELKNVEVELLDGDLHIHGRVRRK